MVSRIKQTSLLANNGEEPATDEDGLKKSVLHTDAPGHKYFRKPFLINRAVSYGDEVVHQLKTQEVTANSAYLGIVGHNSLDLLCMIGKDRGKRHDKAYLFDTNIRQISAMNMMLDIIREEDNPERFIDKFSKQYMTYMHAPEKNDPDYHVYKNVQKSEKPRFFDVFGASHPKYQPQTEEEIKEYLKERMKDHNSWLNSDNYQYIRGMAMAKDDNEKYKLESVNLDLCNDKTVSTFKEKLDEKNRYISDFYLSSIKGFMDPALKTSYYSSLQTEDKVTGFYKNVLKLTENSENVRFINSIPEEGKPFFQNYYVTVENNAGISNLPTGKKSADKPKPLKKNVMTHDYIFTAEGRQWRLMSFKNRDDEPYYRIFSTNPTTDTQKLQKQIGDIDYLLKNMKITANRRIASIETLDHLSTAGNYETKFFNDNEPSMEKGNAGIAASIPFKIKSDQFLQITNTLKFVENAVSHMLSQHDAPDQQEIPAVVFNRSVKSR